MNLVTLSKKVGRGLFQNTFLNISLRREVGQPNLHDVTKSARLFLRLPYKVK